MQKRKMEFPHAYVIIFSLIVIVSLASWIIPAGKFTETRNIGGEKVVTKVVVDGEIVEQISYKGGRNVIVPESFQFIEKKPIGPFAMFIAIPKALTTGFAPMLIFMILLIGAAIRIFDSTGAIRLAIIGLSRSFGDKSGAITLAVITTFFAFLGGFPGMLEAAIPFAPLCIGIALTLGYDVLTGIAVSFIGIVIGWAAGPTNYWTVGIGQSIGEVTPLFAGFGYRLLIWFVLLIISNIFIIRYAEKVRKDPAKSLAAKVDISHLKTEEDNDKEAKLTPRHMIILLIFFFTVGIVAYGGKNWGWSPLEMSACYIIAAIVTGIIAGYSANKIVEQMLTGSRLILVGVLGIGLAYAIHTVMVEGQIKDTLIYYIGNLVSSLPQQISVTGMFIAQSVINFLIPSGSGQALATMPIMIPVGHMAGISPQTAILAFQFGDGLSNIIYPTVGVLIGFLTYSKVPYSVWFKYILPFVAVVSIVAIIFLQIALAINF